MRCRVLQQGTRVSELTKRVGQVPRTGKVVTVRGESVEVKWDDGHVSITSPRALTRIRKEK